MLKSALLCREIREYSKNEISYINVFNCLECTEKSDFFLPVEWVAYPGRYNMNVNLYNPNNQLINVYNNSFTLYDYSSWRDIIGYKVDFKEEGTYKFQIKCNDNIYLEIPLMVSNINKKEIETVEYYINYLK